MTAPAPGDGRPSADVEVSPRAAERLRGGYPWVFAADVPRPAPASAGDVVRVRDRRGALLGTALHAPAAPIVLRMLGPGPVEVRLDDELLASRLVRAEARRRALFDPLGFDAFRVVHGEADLLPGVFLDRYGDALVLQTGCAAMDARKVRIAALAREHLGAEIVVGRDDGSARSFEDLPREKGVLAGSGPTLRAFHDAGTPCEADLLEDGKTGGFLDQQENHARAAAYVRAGATALDTFSYHGGFALALARAGAHVIAVDESAPAVGRIRDNAVRAGVAAAVEALTDNAFDVLRRFEGEGRTFDVVVVDPPALAKRRGAREGGRSAGDAWARAGRAYRELNLRAIRLLGSGGLLVTCSCSGRVSPAEFGAILDEAARDAGRPLQLLERRGAGRDHPVLVGMPESEYLKCFIARRCD